MKKIFHKNNEKNVDQITRSRLIKSTWAVRLLVLLVMITTIFASFAVPASAADPFYGFGKISIDGLKFYQAYSQNINNPIPLNRIDFNPTSFTKFSFNNKVLTVDIHGSSETVLYFDYVNVPVSDIPFERCDQNLTIYFMPSGSVVIPANFNIIDYITEYYPDYLDSKISRISFASVSRTYNFVMRDGYYSIELEGGMRSVFDAVIDWFIALVNSAISLFYVNGVLTPIGAVGVVALGIGVILLIFSLINRYIRFGG